MVPRFLPVVVSHDRPSLMRAQPGYKREARRTRPDRPAREGILRRRQLNTGGSIYTIKRIVRPMVAHPAAGHGPGRESSSGAEYSVRQVRGFGQAASGFGFGAIGRGSGGRRGCGVWSGRSGALKRTLRDWPGGLHGSHGASWCGHRCTMNVHPTRRRTAAAFMTAPATRGGRVWLLRAAYL